MAEYLPLFVLFVLTVLFVVASVGASRLLAPSRSTAAKSAPYESGIVPTTAPAERFPVRFYLVAMIFVIFDIEIVFLYPWAVRFGALGLFGLVEMAVFTSAVVVSLAYLISNGALDWGPGRSRSLEDRDLDTIRRSPNRTIATEAAAGPSQAA